MTTPDGSIDALYQLPLSEFTAARNALAKTATGAAAKDLRALPKPTVLPWAVNQVFWHARSLYDKVLARGRALRTAQLAALKGQKADVRAAADAHRKAIGDAVGRAIELAAKQNLKLEPEPLSRMFDVLSLAAEHPGTPGRLTEILKPQGFESLAGVAIAKGQGAALKAVDAKPKAQASSSKGQESSRKAQEAERKAADEERRAERARQQAEDEVQKAERELERAKTLESAARRDVERATFAVRRAEEALKAAREKLKAVDRRP
jgi:hypothetical protein